MKSKSFRRQAEHAIERKYGASKAFRSMKREALSAFGKTPDLEQIVQASICTDLLLATTLLKKPPSFPNGFEDVLGFDSDLYPEGLRLKVEEESRKLRDFVNSQVNKGMFFKFLFPDLSNIASTRAEMSIALKIVPGAVGIALGFTNLGVLAAIAGTSLVAAGIVEFIHVVRARTRISNTCSQILESSFDPSDFDMDAVKILEILNERSRKLDEFFSQGIEAVDVYLNLVHVFFDNSELRKYFRERLGELCHHTSIIRIAEYFTGSRKDELIRVAMSMRADLVRRNGSISKGDFGLLIADVEKLQIGQLPS